MEMNLWNTELALLCFSCRGMKGIENMLLRSGKLFWVSLCGSGNWISRHLWGWYIWLSYPRFTTIAQCSFPLHFSLHVATCDLSSKVSLANPSVWSASRHADICWGGTEPMCIGNSCLLWVQAVLQTTWPGSGWENYLLSGEPSVPML